MNAIQPSRQPLYPVAPVRKRAAYPRRRTQRQSSQRATALEASAKLTVNCFLAIAALTALVKLVPQNLSQQAKLKHIRTEVAVVESRVNLLQADFNRRFDPNQVNSVMREQSSRVSPGQRQVIWVAPNAASDTNSTTTISPAAESSIPRASSY